MRRWLDAVALIGALALGSLLAHRAQPERVEVAEATGGDALTHERIASATTVADQVLAHLVDPARVVAISAQTRAGSAQWVLGERPRIMELDDVEGILALRPDLLFASSLSASRPTARLREAGVRVVDLGELHGLETLLRSIRTIGRELGISERAEALAIGFERRMAAQRAASVPRISGLFLGAYGGRMYGGTLESSYGDVLDAAGIDDVAAAAGHTGWPEYTAEDLLVLDPDWLVTPSEDDVCGLRALTALRACSEGRVLRVDGAVLGDPGLGMLEAAEVLRASYEAR